MPRPGKKTQTRRASNKPKVPKERQGMVNKIHALLTAKGKHEGKFIAWSYAESILKKLHGVSSLTFATPAQLHDVIAALEYDARRGGYSLSKQRGNVPDWLKQQCSQQATSANSGGLPGGSSSSGGVSVCGVSGGNTFNSGGVSGVGRHHEQEATAWQA